MVCKQIYFFKLSWFFFYSFDYITVYETQMTTSSGTMLVDENFTFYTIFVNLFFARFLKIWLSVCEIFRAHYWKKTRFSLVVLAGGLGRYDLSVGHFLAAFENEWYSSISSSILFAIR